MARTAKPAASEEAAPFAGFARAAPGFLHQLAAEMSREWFLANKEPYEALWVQPMTALLGELRARLAPAYRGLHLAPPKLFRIQRDVRFAKDKAPYKTHCAGVIRVSARAGVGPMEGAGALYLHLGLDEEYVGSGRWMLEPDELARFRKKVADPRAGAALQKLLDAATARGLEVGAHEVLARVPKPYDAEHPRAALLRQKGLTLGFPAIPRGLIHKPALVDWLAARALEAAPVVTWLVKNL